ncbi:unnamed protein product, partial [marine sediment metagenome]
KVDYEGAWKELKEDMGFTSPRDLYQTIVLHMEKLEQKHTHDYIDLKRRSDKEIADYCLKKYAEMYLELVELKNKLKEFAKDKGGGK